MSPQKSQWEAISNRHLKLSEIKEDKGNTMMPAMWLCDWQKGTSWDEMMSSSEEIKPLFKIFISYLAIYGDFTETY